MWMRSLSAQSLTVIHWQWLFRQGRSNAAYGMAYASYPLFENDDFTFTSTATSRAFYAWMNFESPVTSDPAVRKAIAMGIDKDSFVSVLLKGYGYPAVGVFPDTFSFGGQNLTTESYDPDGAKKVLEEAGWVDSDGDGIRAKRRTETGDPLAYLSKPPGASSFWQSLHRSTLKKSEWRFRSTVHLTIIPSAKILPCGMYMQVPW